MLLPVEVDARARVRVREWDPLFDTFLKRNWAQGASNIHRRKHSDDCGAAVGKHALVVFTGTVDFKCDACHKKFMASSSTSLLHLGAWLIKGNGHRTKCVTKLRGLEVDHQWRATSWSY